MKEANTTISFGVKDQSVIRLDFPTGWYWEGTWKELAYMISTGDEDTITRGDKRLIEKTIKQ